MWRKTTNGAGGESSQDEDEPLEEMIKQMASYLTKQFTTLQATC